MKTITRAFIATHIHATRIITDGPELAEEFLPVLVIHDALKTPEKQLKAVKAEYGKNDMYRVIKVEYTTDTYAMSVGDFIFNAIRLGDHEVSTGYPGDANAE